MEKIKKGHILKAILLATSFIFLFESSGYPALGSAHKSNIRVPLNDKADRAIEAMAEIGYQPLSNDALLNLLVRYKSIDIEKGISLFKRLLESSKAKDPRIIDALLFLYHVTSQHMESFALTVSRFGLPAFPETKEQKEFKVRLLMLTVEHYVKQVDLLEQKAEGAEEDKRVSRIDSNLNKAFIALLKLAEKQFAPEDEFYDYLDRYLSNGNWQIRSLTAKHLLECLFQLSIRSNHIDKKISEKMEVRIKKLLADKISFGSWQEAASVAENLQNRGTILYPTEESAAGRGTLYYVSFLRAKKDPKTFGRYIKVVDKGTKIKLNTKLGSHEFAALFKRNLARQKALRNEKPEPRTTLATANLASNSFLQIKSRIESLPNTQDKKAAAKDAIQGIAGEFGDIERIGIIKFLEQDEKPNSMNKVFDKLSAIEYLFQQGLIEKRASLDALSGMLSVLDGQNYSHLRNRNLVRVLREKIQEVKSLHAQTLKKIVSSEGRWQEPTRTRGPVPTRGAVRTSGGATTIRTRGAAFVPTSQQTAVPIWDNAGYRGFLAERKKLIVKGQLNLRYIEQQLNLGQGPSMDNYIRKSHVNEILGIFKNDHPLRNGETPVFLGTDAEFLWLAYNVTNAGSSADVHMISGESLMEPEEIDLLKKTERETVGTVPTMKTADGDGSRYIRWQDNALLYATLYQIIHASIEESNKTGGLFEEIYVRRLREEIEDKAIQKKRLLSSQIAYFGNKNDEVEGLLRREMSNGVFPKKVFALFESFYDNVLSKHDSVVIYDVAAVGAQPNLLYGALYYLKSLAKRTDPAAQAIVASMSPSQREILPKLETKSIIRLVFLGEGEDDATWRGVRSQVLRLAFITNELNDLIEFDKSLEKNFAFFRGDLAPEYIPSAPKDQVAAARKILTFNRFVDSPKKEAAQRLASNEQIKQALEKALIFVEGYGVCSKMSLWSDRRSAIEKDNKALQDAGFERAVRSGPDEVIHISAKESIERIENEFFKPMLEKVEGLESEKGRQSLERFLGILHQEILGVMKRYIEHEEEINTRYGYIIPQPGVNITRELRNRLNRLFSLHDRESVTISPEISRLGNYRRYFSFCAIRYDFRPEGLSLLTTQPAYSIFSKDRLKDTLANVRILEALDRLEKEMMLEGLDRKESVSMLENHIRDFFHSIGANYVCPPDERIVEMLETFTARLYKKEFGRHIKILKELGTAISHSDKEAVSKISKNRKLKDRLYDHGIILTQEGEVFMYYTPYLAMFVDLDVAFAADSGDTMSISSKEALNYLEQHPDLARKIKAYSPRFWDWPLAESQDSLDRSMLDRLTPKNFSITPDWVYSAARRFLGLEVLEPSYEAWEWRPVTDWQGQIVDFGIGTGEFFYQIARTIYDENRNNAKQEYFGTDISKSMVDVARQRGYVVDMVDVSDGAELSKWKKERAITLTRAVSIDTLQHLNREGRENFLRWFMNNAEDNARLFVSLIFEDSKVSRETVEQEIIDFCYSLGLTKENIQLERQGNRTFFYILKPPAKVKEVIGAVTLVKLTTIKIEPDVYPGDRKKIRINRFADGHEERREEVLRVEKPRGYEDRKFKLIETKAIVMNNGKMKEVLATYRNQDTREIIIVLASEKNMTGNEVYYRRDEDNPSEIMAVEVDLPGDRYRFIVELSDRMSHINIIVADTEAEGFSKPLLEENYKFQAGLSDSEIRLLGVLNLEDILQRKLYKTVNNPEVRDILLNRAGIRHSLGNATLMNSSL